MTNEEAFLLLLKQVKQDSILKAAEMIRVAGIEEAAENMIKVLGFDHPQFREFITKAFTHLSELDKEANRHLFN